MKESYKRLLTIYLIMFRIGAITFGGGWSIISQVQEEFADKRDWLTEEQTMDHMSLARTFPGIMIVNFSILSGYTMNGFTGALAAAFGLVSPAVLVISLVVLFYDSISNNPYMVKVFNGIRSAVIPIILVAAYRLKSKALVVKAHWLLAIVAFGICTFTSVPKPVLIIIGGCIGFLIERKVNRSDTAS